MSRDTNGDYSLPPVINPVVPGTTITTAWGNQTLNDIATALTDSLDRNGRGGMLAPFKFTSGTVSAPGITWTAEPTTGFYLAAPGDTRFSLTGNDLMRWTAGVVQVWNEPNQEWDSVIDSSANQLPDGTDGDILNWETDAWVVSTAISVNGDDIEITGNLTVQDIFCQNLTAVSNIKANTFEGDGSLLTNVPSSGTPLAAGTVNGQMAVWNHGVGQWEVAAGLSTSFSNFTTPGIIDGGFIIGGEGTFTGTVDALNFTGDGSTLTGVVEEAPSDGAQYGRENGAWTPILDSVVEAKWVWNDATSGDPGTEQMGSQNGQLINVTELRFSETSLGGGSIPPIDIYQAGDVIYVVDEDRAAYGRYTVVSAADSGAYKTFQVVTDVGVGNPAAGNTMDAVYIPQAGSGGGTAPMVGEIKQYFGDLNDLTFGWHECDGTLGTPDLRNRAIMGAGTSFPYDTTGGQSSFNHTHSGGNGAFTLTASEMPNHNHSLFDTSTATGDLTGFLQSASVVRTTPTGDEYHIGSSGGNTPTIGYSGNQGTGGAHTHPAQNTSNAAIPTLPPYRALYNIMYTGA